MWPRPGVSQRGWSECVLCEFMTALVASLCSFRMEYWVSTKLGRKPLCSSLPSSPGVLWGFRSSKPSCTNLCFWICFPGNQLSAEIHSAEMSTLLCPSIRGISLHLANRRQRMAGEPRGLDQNLTVCHPPWRALAD